MTRSIRKVIATAVIASFFLSGCAGHRAFMDGEELLLTGNYDEAVSKYAEAVSKKPQSHEYRMKLFNARAEAGMWHMDQGMKFLEKEQYPEAIAAFQQALALDPSLESAGQKLKEAATYLKAKEATDEARDFLNTGRLPQARKSIEMALQLNASYAPAIELQKQITALRLTLVDGFELAVSSKEPITLRFSDTNVRDAFGILSKLSGINFIFDEDIRNQKVTIFLEKATFAQALELMLTMNDLGKKVLNPKTIIIYPKTRDKLKQYEEQIIQTFYLSNIDAKKAVNLLRTMLQLRKIFVHEELNALVIRDTPDVIRLAEQIIEAADRPDAEVVFDLELVEVNHSDDWSLGPKLSTYSTKIGLGEPGAGAFLSDPVTSINGLDTLFTIPTATFEMAKTLKDSEVLANPKIRVKNKEKAKVHIGSREPVVTTTTNETGQATSTNIQYIDVGVKLDVEPDIQLDNTVISKLTLEVSSVSGREAITGGGTALTITTTNAQSTLTLKDGERTIIGGLISDNKTKTKTTFPILGAIPIIGDLISGHDTTKSKREILLSITPHIVQNISLPQANVATIWSGGEDSLKAGPMLGAFADEFAANIENAPKAVVPAATIDQPVIPSVNEKEEPETLPVMPAPETEGSVMPPPPTDATIPQEMMPEDAVSSIPPEGMLLLSGPSLVKVGEQVVLEVDIDAINNLSQAPVTVLYDPALLEFVRAEEGSFLKQGAPSTVFTATVSPDQGQVIIDNNQAQGGTGASGHGDLFTLYFLAKNPGKTVLRFDNIQFKTPQGQGITVMPAGLNLEIQ